jgi:tRNA threonylcarbamoyladenosine biosynthesis protein TsaB
VQIGWLTSAEEMRWASSEAEAGVSVFRCIEELGVSPQDAAAIVFCDGPGSILGIRTVAIAIRTWSVLKVNPVFRYHGLELVAHALERPEITFIADARRDHWHSIRLGSPLRRVQTDELSGELMTPDGFRNWTPLPAIVTRVPYVLADLVPRVLDVDLMKTTEAPDAFLHEEPSYVTWTPKVHRAP